MATAWLAEPTRIVRRPPMRSASAPQPGARGRPSQHDRQHGGAVRRGEMPMSLQNATMCACGIDIGTQQQKPARQSSTCDQVGMACRRRAGRRPAVARGSVPRHAGASGGLQQQGRRQDGTTSTTNAHMPASARASRCRRCRAGTAPARRRPRHTGPTEIKRDRRAAAAVEPAADIDQQGRIHAAVAEQADQQHWPTYSCDQAAERGQHQAGRDHHAAEDHHLGATPMRSASQPIAMPPAPVPTQRSAPASATHRSVGAERFLALASCRRR